MPDASASQELIGATEIAEMIGVTRQRMNQMAACGQTLEPVGELRQARIWSREAVEEWARATGRMK